MSGQPLIDDFKLTVIVVFSSLFYFNLLSIAVRLIWSGCLGEGKDGCL